MTQTLRFIAPLALMLSACSDDKGGGDDSSATIDMADAISGTYWKPSSPSRCATTASSTCRTVTRTTR